ncbi:hypothetical protein DIPPA_12628 [Diplonema papillatum]|nr:hypothetical protein DIPPA_12628 [Diplonema papillatum]
MKPKMPQTVLVASALSVLMCTQGAQAAVMLYVDGCSANSSDSNAGTTWDKPLASVARAVGEAAVCTPASCGTTTTVSVALDCEYAPFGVDHDPSSCCPASPHQLDIVTSRNPHRPPKTDRAVITGAARLVLSLSADGLYRGDLPSRSADLWGLWAEDGAGFSRVALAALPVMTYTGAGAGSAGAYFDVPEAQFGGLPRGAALGYAFAKVYQSWTSSLNRVRGVQEIPANGTRRLLLEGNATMSNSPATGSRIVLVNVANSTVLPPESFYYTRTGNSTSRGVSVVYRPAAGGASPATVFLRVPVASTAVAFGNTSHVSMRGSFLVGLSQSQLSGTCLGGCGQSGAALGVATLEIRENSSAVELDGLAVAHTGDYAVMVRPQVQNVVIRSVRAYDLGAGGIVIGPPGTAAVARGVLVTNTSVRDGGHTTEAGAGILLQQAANCTLEHNEIGDMFYTGISTGWDWNYGPTPNADVIVRKNYIHDIGRGVLSDMGCIYNLGLSPRTVFEENICRDVLSHGYGGWGYYADQASEGVTWRGNLAYRTKGAGYMHHWGLNVTVVNNIFMHPRPPTNQSESACIRASVPKGMADGCNVTANICILNDTLSQPLYDESTGSFGTFTMDWNLYFSTAVAQPATALQFPPHTNPGSFAQWQAQGFDAHSIIADPQCTQVNGTDSVVDCIAGLQSSSPALALGFQPIDFSNVGLLPPP